MTLSIGKAWEETSAFLVREGRLVAPVALALFALPSTLLNWAYPPGTTTNGSGIATLVLLLILVAVMIGQMTIILLAIGWHGSIGEAIGKVARRVPSLLGAALIVYGPLLIMFSVALAALLVAAGIDNPAMVSPEDVVKVPGVFSLTILMFAVAAFFSIRLFPMSAVAANEQVRPIALLKRSWALSRGRFGRLLMALALLVIAALALSAAVSTVVGSLATLLLGEPRSFNLSALIVALAGGIVAALISSVAAAMIGRLYVQLSAEPAA